MAFVLGELEIPVRATGMDALVASITSVHTRLGGIETVGKTAMAATSEAAHETKSIYGVLSDSIKGVGEKLLAMGGVDMTPMLNQITSMVGNFGAMGVIVGTITATLAAAVKAGFSWAKLQDDINQLGLRTELMGGNAEDAKTKVQALTKELMAYGIAGAQTRGMLENALGRGLNIDQATNTVRAAIALGQATGMGAERAMRALEAYQEMGVRGLRSIPTFRSDIIKHKSDAEIQQKLNDMIANGTKMLRDKVDTDFEGMLIRIENSFGKIWFMLMKAFGPPVVAIVSVLAQTFQVMGNIIEAITPAFVYLVDLIFKIGVAVGVVIAAKYAWLGIQAVLLVMGVAWTGIAYSWSAANMTLAGSFWAVVGAMQGLLTLTFGKVALIVGVFVGLASILSSIFEPVQQFFSSIFGWFGGLWDKIKGWLGLKTEALKMPTALEPGMTARASMGSIESLWEKFAAAGAEKSTGQQQLEQLQQVNTHLTNISANTMPQGTGRPPVPAGAV